MKEMIHILLHHKNTISVKKVIRQLLTYLDHKRAAELIRSDNYVESYDVNGDGYLNSYDYDVIYDQIYNKYDFWHSGGKDYTILELAKAKKLSTNAVVPTAADLSLDLNNDGAISDADIAIGRHWLIRGKEPREVLK